MENKQIIFSTEARQKLSAGVKKLNDAVVTTLGPLGRCVLIEQEHGLAPIITKDGVTVANSIKLEDPIENMGCELIKEVSKNVARLAGDQTTTATILANSIFQAGLLELENKSNPIQLQVGMHLAVNSIIDSLRENLVKVDTLEQLIRIATISANNDSKMGELIVSAFDKVGKTGIINIQKSDLVEDSLELVKGMEFNRGYLSPYFVTDTSTMSVEFNNPLILLSSDRIGSIKDIIPILTIAQTSGRELLIITTEIIDDTLAALVENKNRGILKVAVIKPPGIGERSKDILKDIALLTGATMTDSDINLKLTDLTIDSLGSADKIIINENSTVIVTSNVNQDLINSRIKELQDKINLNLKMYDIDKLKERIAKLSGGIAIIKVGASTSSEMNERKDRYDDALAATRAAEEEGIVIGGGFAFVNCFNSINEKHKKVFDKLSPTQKTGWNIVYNSILVPSTEILINAGLNDSVKFTLETILDLADKTTGFEILTQQFCNLFEAGIIDAFKAQRLALENAVSAASTLLTTEAVVFIPTKK